MSNLPSDASESSSAETNQRYNTKMVHVGGGYSSKKGSNFWSTNTLNGAFATVAAFMIFPPLVLVTIPITVISAIGAIATNKNIKWSKALFDAIKRGDIAEIEELLNKINKKFGINRNHILNDVVNENGDTIIEAIQKSDMPPETKEKLINRIKNMGAELPKKSDTSEKKVENNEKEVDDQKQSKSMDNKENSIQSNQFESPEVLNKKNKYEINKAEAENLVKNYKRKVEKFEGLIERLDNSKFYFLKNFITKILNNKISKLNYEINKIDKLNEKNNEKQNTTEIITPKHQQSSKDDIDLSDINSSKNQPIHSY